jgi:HPt (histidine-containing phosphotransfer) domain-containing protein
MTTPLFDEEMLADLRDGLAEEDFRAVFAELPDAVRHYRDGVRAAIDGGDRPAVIEAAHSLKGMAASVGATRLAEAALAVERGATDAAAILALETAADATLAAMERFALPA